MFGVLGVYNFGPSLDNSYQLLQLLTVFFSRYLLNSLSKDVKERSLEQEKTRFQLCHFGLHSYKEVAI